MFFLLLLLLLFIPPSKSTRTFLIIDGILFGTTTALLFYTKITFGLVALGSAPIFLLRKRDNTIVIAVGAVIFIGIMASVELGYGTQFAWIADIRMAFQAMERNQFNRVLHISRDNAVELSAFLRRRSPRDGELQPNTGRTWDENSDDQSSFKND